MNFYSVVRYLDKMIPINVEQKRFTHICYKLDMLQYIVKGNKIIQDYVLQVNIDRI